MSRRFSPEDVARLAHRERESAALDTIRALIDRGDHEDARAFLDALAEAGWSPTQGTAEALVEAWSSVRRPEHAAAVVSLMQTLAVTVTRSIRARMVEQWAQVGRAAAAHEALDAMVEAGDDPGGYLHQVAMAAWAKAGAHRKVSDLRRRLIASGRAPDAYHDRYLVEALARAGELSAAFDQLMAMEQAGHMPDHYEYRAIADACLKHVDPAAIESLRSAMVDAGVEPDAELEAAVIETWARSRASDQARRAFDRVKRSRRSAGHWWALMLGYVRDHRLDDAQAVFTEMLDTRTAPEARHYRLLIEAHRRAVTDPEREDGDPAAVIGLLRDALERRVRLDLPTYASAADAFAALARPKEVRDIIAATHLWGPPPDPHLYRALINAEIGAASTTGDTLDRAAAVLDEMNDAGLAPTREEVELVAQAKEERGDEGGAAALRRRYPRT